MPDERVSSLSGISSPGHDRQFEFCITLLVEWIKIREMNKWSYKLAVLCLESCFRQKNTCRSLEGNTSENFTK